MMFMGSPAITHLMDENFQYTFVRDGGLANQKSCFGLQPGVGGREIISSFLAFSSGVSSVFTRTSQNPDTDKWEGYNLLAAPR